MQYIKNYKSNIKLTAITVVSFFKKNKEKLLTYVYTYDIIYIESEVREMRIIKRVLIYIAHRQAQRQNQIREKHNREQIKLILQDFE